MTRRLLARQAGGPCFFELFGAHYGEHRQAGGVGATGVVMVWAFEPSWYRRLSFASVIGFKCYIIMRNSSLFYENS